MYNARLEEIARARTTSLSVGPAPIRYVSKVMNNAKTGNLAVSASLALIAGVLGSVLTLLVTSNLTLPIVDDSRLVSGRPSAQSPSAPSNLASSVHLAEEQAQDSEHLHEEFGEALQQASEERGQLADVLAQLTLKIENLESDLINQQSLGALSASSGSGGDDGQGSANTDDNTPARFRRGTPPATVDNLVAAGVDYTSAQALEARQNQYQLARLELVDQAEREGWRDSEQFSDRLSDLEDQRPDLRTELGDDAYDRYLFEAGRSNRVSIASIIPGSEAELAGVQVGDTVFSYADTRVFTTGELQRATREGDRGELIMLQVDRQGQSVFIEVARGPLGVTLNPGQQSPS